MDHQIDGIGFLHLFERQKERRKQAQRPALHADFFCKDDARAAGHGAELAQPLAGKLLALHLKGIAAAWLILCDGKMCAAAVFGSLRKGIAAFANFQPSQIAAPLPALQICHCMIDYLGRIGKNGLVNRVWHDDPPFLIEKSPGQGMSGCLPGLRLPDFGSLFK